MKKPKVSVIIPTYNRANMIEETIQSVLNQTFQDFEIIIVDDASTDDTERIIKNIDDDRIRYLRHERNKGGSAARNTGIMKARGKYIALFDSDDVWVKEKLERQIDVIENSKLYPGVVYSGVKYIDSNGRWKGTVVPFFKGNIHSYLLEENIVLGGGSTALIRKDCFDKAGLFDENFTSRHDLDLWIRIARKYNFDYVKTPLVYIRIHKNRITEDLNMKINSRKLLFNKIYDELKRDRRKIARYFYETGILYLRVGNMAAGRRYLLKAFSTFPHFKTISALGVSLLGFEGFRLILKVISFLKLWSIVKTFRKFIIKTISLLRNKIS
ncbi:MAG: glycosyltransferase [Candidatus Stahlbacteria bacterium]|nr:MAG: glycosyltransferase [Candidatus Stahlbacteria bacterium]